MKRLLLLLLLIPLGLIGQEEARLDSLRQLARTAAADSTRVETYITLIRHYKKSNEDSCKVYFERLKQYGEGSGSNLAWYHFYRQRAGYYGLFVEKGESSIDYINTNLTTALEYAEKLEDPGLIANTYSRLAEENSRFGLYDAAVEYANSGLAVSTENDLWEDTAYLYGGVSESYLYGYKMLEKSLEFALRSDSIYEVRGPEHEERGFTLSSIGDIYKELGNIEEAEIYQTKALNLWKKRGNTYQEMRVLGLLASIEREKKNYSKAIDYMQTSISYYRENNFPVRVAMYHIGLSEIYFEAGQIAKALEAGQTSIEMNRQNDNSFGVMLALINNAKILNDEGRYAESYDLAKEANGLAKEMDSYIDKEESLKLLYLASEKLGNYKQAYEYSKEHKRVSDTLATRANLKNTRELEARYKRAQQEQEIAVLQARNELTSARQRNQRNLFYTLGGAGVIGLVVLFVLYRNRRRTHEKLVELDAAKTTFFQNISHEFRTPLSLISGPVEKRLENTSLDETDRKEFEMIRRNSNRLMNLIDQLLDISKLEARHYQLRVAEGDLSGLLRSLAASFEYPASEKSIAFKVDIDDFGSVWFDRDAVEKIVVNLLSNAIKYTPEGGEVLMDAKLESGRMHLKIENSGSNFTQQELDSVFERFSRREMEEEGNTPGSGIGLSLVKELVTLSRGVITAENITDNRVRFGVRLPIQKDDYSGTELSGDRETIPEMAVQTLGVDLTRDGSAPVLLVVDDNEDIREFVRDSFKKDYQVIVAEDGEAGIISAIEHIPDIIISDIMMPRIDGVELCSKLKQDIRTSHIPIVLLTAKADDASKYEGLETGADDYVMKPFSVKLLSARIRNLVESRTRLRDRYSKEVILKPTDISINSADERFVQRLQQVLDEKIGDDTFSIEEFSNELHMSRMQLHRKLKALTGLSASEFLRTERLKLAAALLQNKELNINEICFRVGFNSPSYFSKCFKESFGILPTEYRDRL